MYWGVFRLKVNVCGVSPFRLKSGYLLYRWMSDSLSVLSSSNQSHWKTDLPQPAFLFNCLHVSRPDRHRTWANTANKIWSYFSDENWGLPTTTGTSTTILGHPPAEQLHFCTTPGSVKYRIVTSRTMSYVVFIFTFSPRYFDIYYISNIAR